MRGRLITEHTPRTPGVGDIVSDVQSLYALSQNTSGGSGITGYLQDIYTQFNALPGQLRTMQAQVARIAPILEAAKADTTSLMAAQRDLAQLTATLPITQQKVSTLTAKLAPILPDLQAGNIGASELATLAMQGADVVGTYNAVHDLFSLRDDAQAKIQASVTNPSLSPAVAQSASTALAGATSGSWLTYALVAVVGYIGYKVVTGRGQ